MKKSEKVLKGDKLMETSEYKTKLEEIKKIYSTR